VIVRLVVSHPLDEPWTLGSVLLKATFQETVFDALTLTVVLVVLAVAGEAAPERVIVGSVYNTVPVQSPLSYNVNTKVPFNAEPPADVIVAESFGSQSWAVVIDVVSMT
jgi:hypothetical protein